MRNPLKEISPRVLLVASLVLTAALFMSHEIATREAFDASLATVGEIVKDAVPSVLELAEMRARVNHLRGDVSVASRATPTERAAIREGALDELAAIDSSVVALHEIGSLDPERKTLAELAHQAWLLRAATLRVLDGEDPSELDRTFRPAATALDVVAARLVAMHANDAAKAANEIQTTHRLAMAHSFDYLVAVLGCVVALGILAERWLARAEAETQRLIASLDAFAASVAHDLRGPLSPVALALGIVKHDPGLGERSRQSVETAESSVKRAVNLIEGLLSFARSGAKPLAGARCEVARVFADLRSPLGAVADEERAMLTLEAAPALHAAAAEVVLSSIVTNLTRNALLYLGDSEKRAVVVKASADRDEVLIEVADTGPGIPPDVLPRLFQPFQRGTDRAGGHGLGLAIVKRLAEAHGGRVLVRSDVGLGTTFWVRLPRA
jgi:signal transduction histidine kinase